MFSVQAASQGAGQMRPVNSGKLLVECRSSSASLPLVAVDQVVPVRDQVVDRAAVVAERDAAIHAARAPARAASAAGSGRTNSLPVSSGAPRPARSRGPGARSRGSRWACPWLAIPLRSDALFGGDGGRRRALGAPCRSARGGSPCGITLTKRLQRVVPVVQQDLGARALPVCRWWRSTRMRRRSASKRSMSPMPLSSTLIGALVRPARRRPRRRDATPTGSSSTIAVLQSSPKRAVGIVDVGDAARHAGGEVAPGVAQHDHDAAGHVFAAVVAGAFDHRDRARVAHGEALAGDALEIGLAARSRRRARCCRR